MDLGKNRFSQANFNVLEFAEKFSEIFDTENPKNVKLPTIDKSGQLVLKDVPNIAKLHDRVSAKTQIRKFGNVFKDAAGNPVTVDNALRIGGKTVGELVPDRFTYNTVKTLRAFRGGNLQRLTLTPGKYLVVIEIQVDKTYNRQGQDDNDDVSFSVDNLRNSNVHVYQTLSNLRPEGSTPHQRGVGITSVSIVDIVGSNKQDILIRTSNDGNRRFSGFVGIMVSKIGVAL